MQRVDWTLDLQDILSSDLDNMEDYRTDEMKRFTKAVMSHKGVAKISTDFLNSSSTATSFVVTTGTAYDDNGERITMDTDETVDMTSYDTGTTYYLMLKYISAASNPVAHPIDGTLAYTRTLNVSPTIANGGLEVSVTNTTTAAENICLGTISFSSTWALDATSSERDALSVYSESIEIPLYSVTHQNLGSTSNYFGTLYINDSLWFRGSSAGIFTTPGVELQLQSQASVEINSPLLVPQTADTTDIGSSTVRFNDAYVNKIYLEGISLASVHFRENLSLTATSIMLASTNFGINTGDRVYLGSSYTIGDKAGKGITSSAHWLPDTDSTYDLGSSSNSLFWRAGYFNDLYLRNGSSSLTTIAEELVLKGASTLRLNPTSSTIYLGGTNTYWLTTVGTANLAVLFLTSSLRSPLWLYTTDAAIQLLDAAADTILTLKNNGAAGKVLKTRHWYDAGHYVDVYPEYLGNLVIKPNLDGARVYIYEGGVGTGVLELGVLNNGYGFISGTTRLQVFDNSSYFEDQTRSLIGFSYKSDTAGMFKKYSSTTRSGSEFKIGVKATSFSIAIVSDGGIVDGELINFSLSIRLTLGANNGLWHLFGTLACSTSTSQYILPVASGSVGDQYANGGVVTESTLGTSLYVRVHTNGNIYVTDGLVTPNQTIEVTGTITTVKSY